MKRSIEKDRKEELDLAAYYRPIALKAILAASSFVVPKADPAPLPRALQRHSDFRRFEDE
ncbi:hypothetical protein NGR_b19820 (plasmid) [Sinorhizobium fredii NGR234]|uniref:Uncharacterized protein n=1 Tax=Sinorhizobium fredii (strain NBRC 101917 / NGR234) TaxID=394 RepID=C3KLZ3_SINFN|nr:hypothetical protein [Sinorhizobium fredii]ACP23429.1 hypothetical protein NGR_b19820 [Sinorhizobium fredii NGR234]